MTTVFHLLGFAQFCPPTDFRTVCHRFFSKSAYLTNNQLFLIPKIIHYGQEKSPMDNF
ncbi:hypothetical protein TFUB4_00145 [Tannerella forsythia]|nr:hypothetical protein TFUB4_00145 [Tannerella forsythia]